MSRGGKDEGDIKKRFSRLKQGLKREMLKGVHGEEMCWKEESDVREAPIK